MTESRKLAAILAADVVGFSRLTGADEDRTLARLRALRSDLIDPTIAVHNGRAVKRTGDGVLVEFRSVVDAVRCGLEIQNSMIERNTGLPPERLIDFRIGIHLGEPEDAGHAPTGCRRSRASSIPRSVPGMPTVQYLLGFFNFIHSRQALETTRKRLVKRAAPPAGPAPTGAAQWPGQSARDCLLN